MNVLLKNVVNALWHAFDAIQPNESTGVIKSKLKVLTANIATILDLYGVEKELENYGTSSSLNFEEYKHYLLQEVFSAVPNSTKLSVLKTFENRIAETCWMICGKNYNSKVFNEASLYKLFRIYCLLSDLVIDSGGEVSKVLLHASEVALILQQIMVSLGMDCENDSLYNNLTNNTSSFYFHQFLEFIEISDRNDSTECTESINEAVDEIYQTYIKDVIKKGYLLKRGYLLPTLKEYWVVLQPCELSYYKNHTEKECCGNIALDPNCMIKPTPTSSGKHDKFLKFTLSTRDRNNEFATTDHRTRLQWITALQLAITYSTGNNGFQKDIIARRRKKRELDRSRKLEEENLRTLQLREAEAAKQLLEREKSARLAAEIQAQKLEAVAKHDSRRVAELEDVKQNLEKLLQEETQAKRDEEIVRALQARVLAEEWEKREELEQLQEEQKLLLEQERQKRIEFESRQKEKEFKLREAEQKLKQLEEERQNLDLELKLARLKIQQSEENKESLEAKLDQLTPTLETNYAIRRAFSFVDENRERIPLGALALPEPTGKRRMTKGPKTYPID